MKEHEIDDKGLSPAQQAPRPEAGDNVCPECGGSGTLGSGVVCPMCNGTGRVSDPTGATEV